MRFYSNVDITGTITATEQGITDNYLVRQAGHKVLTGTAAPTTATAGLPGQIYMQPGTNIETKWYICTAITVDSTTSARAYTWVKIVDKYMIFKGTVGTGGTVTTLPTASDDTVGWVYLVITSGTYAEQAASVGDMFIGNSSGTTYSWVLIHSGDDVLYEERTFTITESASDHTEKNFSIIPRTVDVYEQVTNSGVTTEKRVIVDTTIENTTANPNTVKLNFGLAITGKTFKIRVYGW